MKVVKRGGIYYADLGNGIGSEQSGTRPVIVLQNDKGNIYSPTVIVATMTTNLKDFITHIIVGSECGLKTNSAIELEQIRTIDKRRLREKIGHVPPEIMEKVMGILDISFGRETKEKGVKVVGEILVKEVNFNGDNLLAVKDANTGKIHISVNHICNGLGLDAENQRIKLKEHMTISKGTMILGVPSNGGKQNAFVIELEFLPLWLAGINPAKVKPEIQDKLIEYQLKAKDVLAAAFLGQAQIKLPSSYAEALRELADKVEENQHLKDENAQLKPDADFGKAIKNNDGLILVRDYVKILANAGIKMKQYELFSWLSKTHYIYQNKFNNYIPYKEFIDQGLFKVIENPIETNTKGSFISFTSKITGKGQEYFLNKLKEEWLCLKR
jgi:phage antirepressor YoqD-like protein/mRNA-degrading endonuclease toxin of MazEF toxin-antitoxin module